jgi:glycosyltransferase involved in cell wall biosynthesis
MSWKYKIGVITTHHGNGYGGAVYSESIINMLTHDQFAEVEVIGPDDYPLTTIPLAICNTPWSKIRKWLNGSTESRIDQWPHEEVNRSRAQREFDLILLDGSLLGGDMMLFKRAFPQSHIGTVFHNIEIDFVDSQSLLKNPHLLIKRRSVKRAELKACQHSDFLIALHQHDSERLMHHYGRGADHILPITIEPPNPVVTGIAVSLHALFVGSLFKPNIDAIKYLYEAVADQSPLPIVVVGRHTERLKERFPDKPNFRILGTVDDLAAWYARAAIVLSPIRTGGGMKVKNIEALAYGKRVICTPHSAIGLEREVLKGYVKLAESAEDFIVAMSSFFDAGNGNSEPGIVDWWEANYSPRVQGALMRPFLDERLQSKINK